MGIRSIRTTRSIALVDLISREGGAMSVTKARKASCGDGSSFGSTDADLIKTLIDIGMCKDCAIRVAPLICTRAMASEDCICSDKCADALDRWAHPFGGSKPAPCLYPFQEQLDRMRARARSWEAAEGAGPEPVGR